MITQATWPKYHMVQTLIRERSPLAFHIPCFWQSLNQVETNAVDSVHGTVFLWFIQNVYTFLSASTHLWSTLKESLVINIGRNRILKRSDHPEQKQQRT